MNKMVKNLINSNEEAQKNLQRKWWRMDSFN